MYNDIMKTTPAVYAVGDEYQIMVPVAVPTLMWVCVGDECYYDDSNGILRSAVTMHRMCVPMDELNKAKKYTICCRRMIERKPYFSETGDIEEFDFEFIPVTGDKINAYHISDAHNVFYSTVEAAHTYEREIGKIDFLILNGDIPNHSGSIENFDTIFEIAEDITHGNIPVVFSRGNHDTRGIYAENIAEYTPCQNGNSYFTFRLGSIWGIVMDCGEDKDDSNEEYGNTVCCHAFRKRQTAFIKNVIKNADNEYLADGITHKIVVVHNPFTQKLEAPFCIENEIFDEWAKLLREDIKPDVMLCGHLHELAVNKVGCEKDHRGQACTVVVGSDVIKDAPVEEQYFAGCGFSFDENGIDVAFTDSKGKVLRKEFLNKQNK